MKLLSIAPVTVASGDYRPPLELTGDLGTSLARLSARPYGPFAWAGADGDTFRVELERRLRGEDGQSALNSESVGRANGLSALAVTRRLRELFPPETILTTDVGSIKLIVSQAWRSTLPMTFLESNGLSAMGYGFPAAMAAKLAMPDRPVLCTMGDGGFAMVFADLETCVRH